jgi:hypothetical protein
VYGRSRKTASSWTVAETKTVPVVARLKLCPK